MRELVPFPRTLERIERWKADPEVLGIVWVGSRTRDSSDALSDDDLEVLLTDEAFARLEPADCGEALIEGEGDARVVVWDAQLLALSELQSKRASPMDLDHWPYERARVLFDRGGAVATAVAAAGRMDPAFRAARLRHGVLDTWIAMRRARKTRDRGYPVAVRALVARGCRALARVVFALEHRWVPLDHWLEAELGTLADPSGATQHLQEAWRAGSPEALDAALTGLAAALEAERVPTGIEQIRALFFELIHRSNATERAVHGIF